MTEYIEREAAKRSVNEHYDDAIIMALDALHAADVAPVRHGRWISAQHKRARICSECYADEPYKFADTEAEVFAYCPNCGARMDGGET